MLYKEIEKMRVDKRLFDWHILTKKMTPADLKKHLDALPDLAHQVEQLEINENEEPDTH